MKYMLTTDGSPNSTNALGMVAKLMKDSDELVVLSVGHVEDHFWEDDAAKAAHHERARTYHEKIVEKTIVEAGEAGIKNVTGKVTLGQPRDEILHLAESENVDVIAMGARGLGAVKRLLLGSVSDHVMKNAHCNVLIAKA
eukprot:CAMPEP_0114612880 /NCGR_PEP_ID=MMETSP0168-20121206/4845_1 /TAXON_ID=95228 ORGANISM="Vannella sp., Strain DIVA3 517/6/12" /NCGR_SAMPLE_ID=MMETSP0168 /ASSEMBLY_ACC=CAM_ASM_000044 /LENGTH=139 /DNA_ID=CAMNT_0001823869 /DNA_START=30 /DNA_END=449 /DNA_ORIENTATION=-